MKKTITRIGALLLSSLILIGSSISSYAATKSYTYNYDYWGDVQSSPDLYSVCKVFTSTELKLDVAINDPQGVYVDGDTIYLCDTGNNRIIILKRTSRESIEVDDIVTKIKGNVEVKDLSKPTDLAVSEEGNIFICDKGNERIVKVDKDFNYISEFIKPIENTLDPKMAFAPNKLVIDTAERVYCIADGINKGLIKYETDGTFSGFVGATRVVYDFTDYMWKKIASQEQLEKMDSFVPTEYSNLYVDKDGFIYASTMSVTADDLRSGSSDAVRKLNLLGDDILVRNGVYYDGKFPVYGDLYMGNGGGFEGCSLFVDVTAFDNDVYVCLDRNRGRLFAYDEQGRLIYSCGGNGNMDGYFRKPVAIDHMDYDLLVVDQLDCAITLFTLTDFGQAVFDAMDLFEQGRYDESGEAWEHVMRLNGNYDLAYIGIGRTKLRQKEYKEAMDYFELKYDAENYSKAYKQYRKIWVEDNIVAIVVIILVLFFVPATIGKYKSIKHEFETADIFKV